MRLRYKQIKILSIVALCAVALTGCAQQPGYGGSYNNNGYNNNGYNNNYNNGPSANCVGATLGGAVVGGLVGSRFGGGHGRTAMTGVGAAGGALVGQQMGCQQQAR